MDVLNWEGNTLRSENKHVQIELRLFNNGNLKPIRIKTETRGECCKQDELQQNVEAICGDDHPCHGSKFKIEADNELLSFAESATINEMYVKSNVKEELEDKDENGDNISISFGQNEEHYFVCEDEATSVENVIRNASNVDLSAVEDTGFVITEDGESGKLLICESESFSKGNKNDCFEEMLIVKNEPSTDLDLSSSNDTDIDDVSGLESDEEQYDPNLKSDKHLNQLQTKCDKAVQKDNSDTSEDVVSKHTCKLVDAKNIPLATKEKQQRKFDGSTIQGICCQLCGNIYASKNRLDVHVEEIHYRSYVSQCCTCFKPFHSSEEKHNHRCTRYSKHKCLQCSGNIFFRYRENLVKHIEIIHGNKFPLVCRVCSLPLVSENEKKHHLLKKHGIVEDTESIEIEKIDGTTDSKLDLTEDSILSVSPSMTCGECGKKFSDPSKFERHVKRVCIERTHACSVCGKKFKSEKNVRDHAITHSNTRPYVCQLCGETYTHKCSLTIHVKSKHTLEKGYRCDVCGKEFSIYNSFRRHEIVHTGARPYKCNFCEKSFSTVWNRNAHERRHTKETPYVCTKCGHGFAHNVVRKNHEAKCTG